MWKRLTLWALVLALAAGAILAGCGGGGDDSNDNDPKSVYIKRADQICALGTFRIGSEGRRRFGSTQPTSAQQVQLATQVVVPTLQQVLDRLRALTPPPGDRQQVNAVFDALQASIDNLKANPDLIAQPNAGGAFDQPNRLAQAYGFHQCGSG